MKHPTAPGDAEQIIAALKTERDDLIEAIENYYRDYRHMYDEVERGKVLKWDTLLAVAEAVKAMAADDEWRLGSGYLFINYESTNVDAAARALLAAGMDWREKREGGEA